DLVEVVALVQAHPLRLGLGRLGPTDGDAADRLPSHLEVVAVGPVHRHPDGDAMALGQQAPLDPALATIRGVFARLFPPQGVPWSCTRPSPARTSRSPSARRTPVVRPSKASGTRRRPPTPGTGRGPWTRG